MNRQVLINNVLDKINKLPDTKIEEINKFAEKLLNRIDDKIILENIQQLSSNSKSFDFLDDEEDLYSVNDLKIRYK